jgi:uncharacterized protein
VTLVAAWAGLALGAPTFPALSGRVVDEAGMLSATTEAELAQLSESLEQRTGTQIVVATVPDLQGYEVEEFGYKLGRAWGLGSAEGDDGLLLLVAKEERKVRVEVGYGLEGVVTDAYSAIVIQRQVVPRFKQGDFDGGVLAGAQALADQVGADPERQKQNLQQATESNKGVKFPPQLVILALLVLFIVVTNGPRGRRGRRYRGSSGWGGPVVVWGGSGGGWGGGGGSNWGGGGGGFGGGGGSFGGGGASGSW